MAAAVPGNQRGYFPFENGHGIKHSGYHAMVIFEKKATFDFMTSYSNGILQSCIDKHSQTKLF